MDRDCALEGKEFISFGHFVIKRSEICKVSIIKKGLSHPIYQVDVYNPQNERLCSRDISYYPKMEDEIAVRRIQQDIFGADLGITCAGYVRLIDRVLDFVGKMMPAFPIVGKIFAK